MARKISTDTLDTLNQIARFLHFDPRAKKGILSREQLSIRTGIGYNKLTRIMTDSKFSVIFDESIIGSIILSSEIPAFLEDVIDLNEPYVPIKCACGCEQKVSQSPQNTTQPKSQHKKYHTKFYSEQTLNSLLSDTGQQVLEALLREPKPVKPGNDQTHTWWQLQNLVNYLQTNLDLVKAADPKAKAAEIIDNPNEFPPLNTILGNSNNDTVTGSNKTVTVTGEVRVLGQTIPRDKIKEAIEFCHTKSRLDGYKNPDNDNRTVYYYELAKELEKYV